MISGKQAVMLIIIAGAFAMPASASYAGDKPLNNVFNETMHGGYEFTTGNSTYSETLVSGESYAAEFSLVLPEGAEIIYERVYVYWAWSKCGDRAVYPSMQVECNNGSGQTALIHEERYVDNKGFASASDFFSGMDAYSGTDIHDGDNRLSVVATNTGDENCTFVIQGVGVLVIYSDEHSSLMQIWVNEGCDMLYASYGITPDMATSRIDFPGRINTDSVTSADLFLVAPSGGYTRSDRTEKNTVSFNRKGESSLPSFIEIIIKTLFPGYNGQEWTDAFMSDELHQIGTDTRYVEQYLRPEGNMATVQDNGDYLLLTNAVLCVEHGGGD